MGAEKMWMEFKNKKEESWGGFGHAECKLGSKCKEICEEWMVERKGKSKTVTGWSWRVHEKEKFNEPKAIYNQCMDITEVDLSGFKEI